MNSSSCLLLRVVGLQLLSGSYISRMMEKLTPPQFRALEFIRTCIDSQRAPPTLRELCEYMQFSAIGSAQDLVSALRRKGFLMVPEQQSARALQLSDKAIELFYGREGDELADEVFSIFCLGSVPAGNPLEAVEERVGVLSFSASLLPKPKPRKGQLFGLRAQGESMIGAGICDGDWLIVKSQRESSPGKIVVATIEGEATVKRLMRDTRRGWYLKPENERFQPVHGDESPFVIVGEVLALQRSI